MRPVAVLVIEGVVIPNKTAFLDRLVDERDELGPAVDNHCLPCLVCHGICIFIHCAHGGGSHFLCTDGLC